MNTFDPDTEMTVHDDMRSCCRVIAIRCLQTGQFHLMQIHRQTGKVVTSLDSWISAHKAKLAFSRRDYEWYRKPV